MEEGGGRRGEENDREATIIDRVDGHCMQKRSERRGDEGKTEEEKEGEGGGGG